MTETTTPPGTVTVSRNDLSLLVECAGEGPVAYDTDTLDEAIRRCKAVLVSASDPSQPSDSDDPPPAGLDPEATVITRDDLLGSYEPFVASSGERMVADVLVPLPGSGAALIAAERARQVTEEGWTAEHDAGHADGDLAIAAACYAVPAGKRAVRSFAADVSAGRGSWYKDIPDAWPWHPGCWKPSPDDRIRELVKAGALIAAEIDRLQRAEAEE